MTGARAIRIDLFEKGWGPALKEPRFKFKNYWASLNSAWPAFGFKKPVMLWGESDMTSSSATAASLCFYQ